MVRSLLTLLIVFISATLGLAKPPAAKVEARLAYDALHAGQQTAVAVVVTIPDGFHAQSHTPGNDDYIAFTVSLPPHAAGQMTLLPPVYPKGEDVTYAALGKLNVYTGGVVVYVPLQLASDTPAGNLSLPGSVRLQMCDERSCFQPADVPWEVTLPIVGADHSITPANQDLFAGFDSRVFSANASATPPPTATNIPNSRASLQFFGWTLALEKSSRVAGFAIAFVVGIIFNLMPCVLPVLPLKAIGFYEASQHNRLKCLLLGVVFSAGLLAVFAVLGVLVIIRGQAWGQLFANAWFVWSIVAILIVMAAGQLGAFSLVLPQAIYSAVPGHSSWTGNFLFGGFTAILSTPCTAPMFVGLLLWTAGQPTWVGLTTLQCVGLGMASPYLLLAGFPELARRVPRAGAWSEVLKQFMAFLLLAVAAYFGAGRLMPGNSYLWIVFAVVAAGGVFLVARTSMLTRSPRAIGIAAAVAILLAGTMLYLSINLNRAEQSLIAWRPYSDQTLQQAIRDKRVVLLEFTANWCANCKELESRVFSDPRAAKAIADSGAIALRADLTHDDAPGWAKLKSVNESGGIPLTLIYSPLLEQPLQLSSIYTTANLVAGLEKAGGK